MYIYRDTGILGPKVGTVYIPGALGTQSSGREGCQRSTLRCLIALPLTAKAMVFGRLTDNFYMGLCIKNLQE